MRSALVPILLADPLPWAQKAEYAWDFLRDRARFGGRYRGVLANTPGWTFTRASTGYYTTTGGVLVPFASGSLRTGDRGALIEGAGTNLCLQSQTFDNASWTKTRSSISADAVAAPDGTTTADKLVEDSTAANNHRLSQAFVGVDNTTYTFSIYVKAAERTWAVVALTAQSGGFRGVAINLSTGALGTTSAATTAKVTSLASGWYRVSVSADIGPAGAGETLQVYPATGDWDGTTAPSYNGDGASGIYLWGAQLEAASFPSSYIPTTTASATRAPDVLSVPVSGIDYPLSVYVETDITQNADGVVSQGLLTVSGAANNNFQFMRGPAPSLRSVVVATTTQMDTSAGSMSAFGTYKTALRVAANDSRHCLNGALQTADTSVTLPSAPTIIEFGSRGSGSSPLWSYIRKAALWTRALSDSELQSVST